jgi:hypothetical protein
MVRKWSTVPTFPYTILPPPPPFTHSFIHLQVAYAALEEMKEHRKHSFSEEDAIFLLQHLTLLRDRFQACCPIGVESNVNTLPTIEQIMACKMVYLMSYPVFGTQDGIYIPGVGKQGGYYCPSFTWTNLWREDYQAQGSTSPTLNPSLAKPPKSYISQG